MTSWSCRTIAVEGVRLLPKKTFFNLPEDKRQRIIEAAIDEFAKYPYDKASINRIVENSGIAKGSFYQYFEDKKDLYKYILELAGEEKEKYISQLLKVKKELDFFEMIRQMYIAGVKFSKDNPKFAEIANHFIKSTDASLKEEIFGDSIPKGKDIFKGMLLRGIQKGDIDPSIDVDLVSQILTTISISIGEYFIKEVKVNDNFEIMDLVDKMLYVIAYGIKNRKGGISYEKDFIYI